MGVTQDHWDRRMEEAERLEQIALGYRWCAICRRRLDGDAQAIAVGLALPDGTIGELCSYCQDRNHQPDGEQE